MKTQAIIISDSHLRPGYPCTELWEALGRYCVKHKPDYIIHLGDAADLQSQQWLKAQRGDSTIEEEIDFVRFHLAAFHHPIEMYNRRCRESKHKQYKPKFYFCCGNHDVRNDTGMVEDLFHSFGWIVFDYLEPLHLGNFVFCHAMRKGLSDQMCTTAQELLENWHGNVVVGHGHHRDFYESFSIQTNQPIIALRSPVFTPYHTGDWCMQTRDKWSRGFTELDIMSGDFAWRPLRCLFEN